MAAIASASGVSVAATEVDEAAGLSAGAPAPAVSTTAAAATTAPVSSRTGVATSAAPGVIDVDRAPLHRYGAGRDEETTAQCVAADAAVTSVGAVGSFATSSARGTSAPTSARSARSCAKRTAAITAGENVLRPTQAAMSAEATFTAGTSRASVAAIKQAAAGAVSAFPARPGEGRIENHGRVLQIELATSDVDSAATGVAASAAVSSFAGMACRIGAGAARRSIVAHSAWTAIDGMRVGKIVAGRALLSRRTWRTGHGRGTGESSGSACAARTALSVVAVNVRVIRNRERTGGEINGAAAGILSVAPYAAIDDAGAPPCQHRRRRDSSPSRRR